METYSVIYIPGSVFVDSVGLPRMWSRHPNCSSYTSSFEPSWTHCDLPGVVIHAIHNRLFNSVARIRSTTFEKAWERWSSAESPICCFSGRCLTVSTSVQCTVTGLRRAAIPTRLFWYREDCVGFRCMCGVVYRTLRAQKERPGSCYICMQCAIVRASPAIASGCHAVGRQAFQRV